MLYLSTLAANRRQRAEEREGVIQMRPRSAWPTLTCFATASSWSPAGVTARIAGVVSARSVKLFSASRIKGKSAMARLIEGADPDTIIDAEEEEAVRAPEVPIPLSFFF